MEINKLILVVKEKLEKNISIEEIIVEDKTFLHKNHSSHQKEKYHLKLQIKSKELKKCNKIVATKKIYKILDIELKNYIHSIQILII
tara:strand:- start:1153 stop:1413 length:261 start_codon:yes stop_codon:yes gene_type:complete